MRTIHRGFRPCVPSGAPPFSILGGGEITGECRGGSRTAPTLYLSIIIAPDDSKIGICPIHSIAKTRDVSTCPSGPGCGLGRGRNKADMCPQISRITYLRPHRGFGLSGKAGQQGRDVVRSQQEPTAALHSSITKNGGAGSES